MAPGIPPTDKPAIAPNAIGSLALFEKIAIKTVPINAPPNPNFFHQPSPLPLRFLA